MPFIPGSGARPTRALSAGKVIEYTEVFINQRQCGSVDKVACGFVLCWNEHLAIVLIGLPRNKRKRKIDLCCRGIRLTRTLSNIKQICKYGLLACPHYGYCCRSVIVLLLLWRQCGPSTYIIYYEIYDS